MVLDEGMVAHPLDCAVPLSWMVNCLVTFPVSNGWRRVNDDAMRPTEIN
jgi:hypothetical protein